MRKEFEVEIAGKTRGFKFGTYQMGISCQEEGLILNRPVDMVLFGKRMSEGHLITTLNILYGAAYAYCVSKKLQVDFSPIDVSDWLEEIGFEKGIAIVTEGMQTPKNPEAPQTVGRQ